MSLTRFLPTPSDRMGILASLLRLDESIILEYGTSGTTAYALKYCMINGVDVRNRLFTTEMKEDNVVMGDSSNLEQKLRELDQEYRPRVIFVMASSVASVIGADLRGVCHYMQEEISAKLIVFTQGGFSGDYSSGYQIVLTRLIEELACEAYAPTDSFNIIAPSFAQSDLSEISRMMKQYFDLSPYAILAAATSISQIESMSQARINLVLSYEGLEAAQILEARFGTPFIHALPLGQKGSCAWLEKIAQALGKHLSLPEASYTSEEKRKVMIHADYDVALALESAFTELGADVTQVLCRHATAKIASPFISQVKREKELLDLYRSQRDTIILGDAEMLQYVDSSCKRIALCHDIFTKHRDKQGLFKEIKKIYNSFSPN